MSAPDDIVRLIDEGLAAAASIEPGYGPPGSDDADMCWRCAVAASGDGVTGLCEACVTVMREERPRDAIEGKNLTVRWVDEVDPARWVRPTPVARGRVNYRSDAVDAMAEMLGVDQSLIGDAPNHWSETADELARWNPARPFELHFEVGLISPELFMVLTGADLTVSDDTGAEVQALAASQVRQVEAYLAERWGTDASED